MSSKLHLRNSPLILLQAMELTSVNFETISKYTKIFGLCKPSEIAICSFLFLINILAPELFSLILAHSVYKM